MARKEKSLWAIAVITATVMLLHSCAPSEETKYTERLNYAVQQFEKMAEQTTANGELLLPCTIKKDGTLSSIGINDWRSGFFPGSMWYLYKMTGDTRWNELATRYDRKLEPLRFNTNTHDIGFMVGDSWGNEYRFTQNKECVDVIVDAAHSLATRFHNGAGIIQSWNKNDKKDWICPVIIDNMMNLELLFEAAQLSGDDSLRIIAISHANQTLANHFRPDGSCWHVLDYDPDNGTIRHRNTHQGYSDESTWSRGHAWAIYGFTLAYRYTKDSKYLDRAIATFDYMRNHRNMPNDCIPYWDMEVPDTTNEPRDASAAAIIASALLEISQYVPSGQSEEYIAYSDKIMDTLSSEAYRAPIGENDCFLLMHSTGSKPHNSEVDTPLNYADYYYLEALYRRHTLNNK